ncbi:M13 family metallopeptidase [Kocuria sp. HSID16901]|uniref:M13 family metallopeptidase n=1 Tax=Kocuria sp. HSID16901 TaxID=2419505 RepID=UPI000660AAE0|nr:M13-type metalloendopeptidase [Kocuria sp. HSID16901]RUQ21807.1 peptidase M13 [Kocuria sp. HSID16901]
MTSNASDQHTAPAERGLDTAGMDTTVDPKADLYRYANGAWIAQHDIPSDRGIDGAFYALRDRSEEQIRDIITAAGEADPESKVGALYNSFMDEEAIEKAGNRPLDPDLELLQTAQDKDGLVIVMAALDASGVGSPVGVYVNNDAKKATQYVPYLAQSGLGLPDEEYYREEKYAEIREAYREHIASMLKITGVAERFGTSPEDAAQTIFDLETRLAEHHWDKVACRDAHKTYNPYSPDTLSTDFPGFPWERWIEALGGSRETFERVVVAQPSYLRGFADMWASEPMERWVLWLAWHIAHSRAAFLHSAAVRENFEFYSKRLMGTEEMRDRWKRGVGLVESLLGEEVGKEYVARHFPPEHKARMQELVGNLIEAYRESISSLEWMTPETRERALEKLGKFTPKIGYPDEWRDYSSLIIGENVVENVKAGNRFEHDYELGKLGQPINVHEWHMTPQTVNAYFNPVMNEIVFPAAILQPPFFSMEAEDAANYGGIGSVIGHEIGHGFDDQGAKYDGDGNLNDWWTEADLREFEKRTSSLVSQYSEYTPEGLDPAEDRVNGELTLGENIGDLGGLTIAIKAYRKALDKAGTSLEEAPKVDGVSATQRLILAYAQIWRSKARTQTAKMLLSIDPHSPSEFRCNGTVRNVDEYHEAFGVQPGDDMWLAPEERVRIW